MINATKQFYKTKNKGNDYFVSKLKQTELVASMIKNNLKSFVLLKKYKTEINPKLDELKDLNKIQKYIEELDYTNRLYFYSASLLELVLFNNNLLENNKEFSLGTKNAMIIKELVENNDVENKLCANFYVNKSDLKNIVLNVFCDLYDSQNIKSNEVLNPILVEYLSSFEKYFENKLTPIDIFARLLDIKNNSILTEDLNYGVEKLNSQIKNVGGIFNGVKIDFKDVDDVIENMSKIIGKNELENQIGVLKDNVDLYSLTDYVVEINISDENLSTELENYVEENVLN